jgi:hypothetical protein
MRTSARARANITVDPTGTVRPARRNAATNPTASAWAGASPGRGLQPLRRTASFDQGLHAVRLTRSWSSRYFSTVPKVASMVATSSWSRPSMASAAAQSIVSATPGGL